MRGTAPTITCDGDGGLCDEWGVDFYEVGASFVDGTRLTDSQRIPRWSTGDYDYCPEHQSTNQEDQA